MTIWTGGRQGDITEEFLLGGKNGKTPTISGVDIVMIRSGYSMI